MNPSRALAFFMGFMVALLVVHAVLAVILYAVTRELGFAGIALACAVLADCAAAIQRRVG